MCTSQAAGILATDLFSVETIGLKTIYVLFFIELSTRRVHVAGVTTHPDSRWVPGQARNLAVDERLSGVRFLLRDRDATFCGPFDAVLCAEGVRVIRTPIRAPRANAFAARFLQDRAPRVPRPCPDLRSSASRASAPGLRRSLRSRKTTSGTGLGRARGDRTPQVRGTPRTPVERRDVLGGLIHEYRWAA
jgi:hypothetical protein